MARLEWDPLQNRYVYRTDPAPTFSEGLLPQAGPFQPQAPALGGAPAPIPGAPTVPPEDTPVQPIGPGVGGRDLPFNARRPRAANFLGNLGAALQAIQIEPPQLQSAPTSPLAGVLSGLAGGAQAFSRARGIKQEQAIEQSPVARSAMAKVQANRLHDLTPGEIFILQRRGMAPQQFVGGQDIGRGQRISLGLEPSYVQEKELGLRGREVKAGEEDVAIRGRRADVEAEVARFGILRDVEALGFDRRRTKALEDQLSMERRKLGIAIGRGVIGATPAERQAAIKYGMWVAGVGPEPSDSEIATATGLEAIEAVEAEARAFASGAKENIFVRTVDELLSSIRSKLTPEQLEDVLRAKTQITSPGFYQRFIDGDPAATGAMERFNEILGPKQKGVFQKAREWLFGREGATQPPEQQAADPAALQAEYRALQEKSRTGILTPEERARASEIYNLLANQRRGGAPRIGGAAESVR